jgi:ribosomal protein S14
MKKLLEKDKKSRHKILSLETRYFILKSIFNNLNYSSLIRWNAFSNLNNIPINRNKIALSNRCLITVNKKRFNKLTNFSRHIFLKLIRSGQIHGMKKSSW